MDASYGDDAALVEEGILLTDGVDEVVWAVDAGENEGDDVEVDAVKGFEEVDEDDVCAFGRIIWETVADDLIGDGAYVGDGFENGTAR